MRFDDRLLTAVAMGRHGVGDAAARWTQLVDLIAQPEGLPEGDRATILAEASSLAPKVEMSRRVSVARSVAARAAHRGIVELFAHDAPKVAAPVLLGARLSDQDWQALIPRLPAPSRSLLRQRRDLPPGAVAALMTFGPSDFALPDRRLANVEKAEAEVGNVDPATSGVSRISDLVAKIETWRLQRDVTGQAEQIRAQPPVSQPAQRFQFSTDAAGVIMWVSGAPRASVFGVSLSEPEDSVWGGVDAATADAVARREDIYDGRLVLPGETSASGRWLISALPRTDSQTGQFLGYVGMARRSEHQPSVALSAKPSHDIVRQIVHELRSPLNAIHGFAELIEHQIAGPVGQRYRQRAAAIMSEAATIVSLVDTIDDSARAPGRAVVATSAL